MPKDKAPGCDGIPTEFFQEFMSEISPTLLQAFLAMLRNRETSELINKGLIILIPKSGNHARIGNWRPIILLGSLYKILAKTLARRLQTFLPNIIRPSQTGFVEGRCILDNTFLTQEAQDWAEENNQVMLINLTTASAKEFRRSSSAGRVQATSSHCTTIPFEGYEPVRVLAQDGHGTTLRLAKDLLPPGKKPPIYWIFESGFISDLPWDPGDWHWQSMRNMGDAPFFGYSSKRGYQNAKKNITPPASSPSSRTWICTT
jgi:hypothetical protein